MIWSTRYQLSYTYIAVPSQHVLVYVAWSSPPWNTIKLVVSKSFNVMRSFSYVSLNHHTRDNNEENTNTRTTGIHKYLLGSKVFCSVATYMYHVLLSKPCTFFQDSYWNFGLKLNSKRALSWHVETWNICPIQNSHTWTVNTQSTSRVCSACSVWAAWHARGGEGAMCVGHILDWDDNLL